MASRLTFFGAAETVTGSRHLLDLAGHRILIDCGLFQGPPHIAARNDAPFPVPTDAIDGVLITHAHLDHLGYLPKLIRDGYQGPIHATRSTVALARITLPDSGRIQEEDARQTKRHGRDGRTEPLYTERDAIDAVKRMSQNPFETVRELRPGIRFQFLPAGHILGSAFAEIRLKEELRVLMGGDLGRYDMPILRDPAPVEEADILVLESTYGDRRHGPEDPLARLEEVMARAAATSSAVLVPSFAIGRTQELLYFLHTLQQEGRMPRMPIFLDSPMAISATQLYAVAADEYDEDMQEAVRAGKVPLGPENLHIVRDRNGSKELNHRPGPFIVIAGSGMATGGRIQHHLKNRLGRPDTIVLFTGYQAEGTLGRQLLQGAREVRILGDTVSVEAKVEGMTSLSAHADQGEILRWLGNFQKPPRRTFLVHGEPPAQAELKARIEAELGWDVAIPRMGESFEL
jgi:metallo-beta-lactamase family protein